MKPRWSGPPGIRARVAWLPAFFVGFGLAAVGETAAALLLYSDEGFLVSLTVVLATEMAALGAGFLFSVRLPPWDPDPVRYRWLLAVLSFGGAAVFAGAWSLGAGFPASGPSQGLGLGLLAGLPFFAGGAVLGALAGDGRGAVPTPEGRADPLAARSVAPAGALGAAGGVVLSGLYGFPTLEPASLLLLCVVLISAGALVHGWLVDGQVRARVVDRSDDGGVVLERWSRASPEASLLVLRTERGLADAAFPREEEGDGSGHSPPEVALPWQRQALDLLGGRDGPVLLLGVGTGALLHTLAAGGRRVDGVALRPLPRRLRWWERGSPGDSGLRVVEEAGIGPVRGEGIPFPLEVGDDPPEAIVVNLGLLPPSGPLSSSSRELVAAAADRLGPGGLLLLGGVPVNEPRELEEVRGFTASLLGSPPSAFRPDAGSWSRPRREREDLLDLTGDGGGGLLVHDPGAPAADRPAAPGGRGP